MASKNDTRNDVILERVETKLDMFKEHFDRRISSVDEKLVKLDSRSDAIDVTLVKQQVILDEHVRRTNLLEQKLDRDVDALNKKIDTETKVIETSITPLQAQDVKTKMIVKFLLAGVAALAAGGGAGLGLQKLFEFLIG